MLKKYLPNQLAFHYNRKLFKYDLIAGLTLYVMLIPQSMAYAMLAGLPPVMGLYASTIPLIIYALFASSKHLSVGPVAITSLLVFSGVSVYAEPGTSEYISIVLILALMVGIIQLLLGTFKGGFIVKFIPHSVLNGYTSAAAIVIGFSQLKHLLGVEVGNYLQVQFLLFDVINKFSEIHIVTLIVGLFSIIGLLLIKKMNPKLPSALIIVMISLATVMLLGLDERGLQIIGNVPQGLPLMIFPEVTFQKIQMLFPMALTISLIAFMESLAISKAIARIENYKISPNKELRALGISNIIGSCFQSFPINGSFSRTAVNHQAGGRTQVTSIITGVCVIITLLFFTSLFYYLPNAVLAAIIIVAVYNLIDIKEMKHLFKVKPLEGWIWVITFFVTLFVGIQWGIMIGAIFTLILLLNRSFKPNIAQLGYVRKERVFRDIKWYPEAITSEIVLIIRIDSSLHFANISYLDEKLKKLYQQNSHSKWLILDMSGVNDIDTVSIEKLEESISYFKERNVTVLFTNMKGAIRHTVNKVGWHIRYKEQKNHLTVKQILKEKGIHKYFEHNKTSKSKNKEWIHDYSI
ncbi:sodium-independent anion transporter [Anaerobacillus alkalilacustris]|uniref:Sodium-independent anion transporter n=1 Tax=Anaerobacillus alkalilacustris TaxID=393763 RepID=A0A1S2LFC1_9BACI|nr:solute carrier family 26 protein [Anaerobacillus alkalilacustris]OIJ11222.1 sodium-independent anion transporter [Anaerobacillus alkalilacustris]